MPAESPEAVSIPTMNPRKRSVPLPPQVVNFAAAGENTIYDESIETPCEVVWVHNIGANTINYCKNGVASSVIYHDVIAAGSAVGDGIGSKVEFRCREMGIRKISLYATGASAATVEKNLNPYALHA
jgi:hypothetical protein